jgi:hypothetical protein
LLFTYIVENFIGHFTRIMFLLKSIILIGL